MNPNIDLELIRRLLLDSGVNLAGQQTPGETPGEPLADIPPPGSYGFYTPDFSYGSYQMPYEDPTYRSGFEYARTIAGGMPFEDVVAPGMSFSPDQPMGYTQADLRREQIYGDFNGVMPTAPTKGTPVEASYETMPDAPVGTPAPERYVPGQTPFPGIPDFLKDLDFSNLPGVQEPSKPQFGSSAPAGFIPPPPGSFNTMAFVDYYNPTTGETWSAPSGGWTAPEGWVIGRPDGGLKFTFDEVDPSVVPTMPMESMVQPITEPVIPAQTLPQNIFANIPTPQPLPMPKVPVMPKAPMQTPMNFTALPKMPVIPNIPTMPQPIVPQPIPRVSTPLIPSFVQPNIEEIVRPIAVGKQGLPQYGLFNLV